MAVKIYRRLPAAITHCLFDADQTLYPKSSRFESKYIVERIYYLMLDTMRRNGKPNATMQEAVQEGNRFYRVYHSSYVGLQKEYGLTMKDIVDYIYHNGELDYGRLGTCTTTREGLSQLRYTHGMRLAVLTNGTDVHAHAVIKTMGLEGLFGVVHGFNHNDYKPKPNHSTFQNTLWEMNAAPEQTALFEDAMKNLKAAKELNFGYRVYIGEEETEAPANEDGTIDLWANTLPEALDAINAMLAERQ